MCQKIEYNELIEDYMSLDVKDLWQDAFFALRKTETELASMTKLEIASEMARYELGQFFK